MAGYILISSVLSIRNYYRAKNNERFINTDALQRHSICFGLYLVSTTIYTLSYTCKVIWFEEKWLDKVNGQIGMFVAVASLISQIMLVGIFKQIISHKIEFETDSSVVSETVVEDFDEDALLQANIWNNFMRNDAEATAAGASVYKAVPSVLKSYKASIL